MSDKITTVEGQLLFSVEASAKMLNVSKRLVWQYIASGELKTRSISGRRLVHKRELERFAARDHQRPTSVMKEEKNENGK